VTGASDDLLELRLRELLDAFAGGRRGPGGGSAAAIVAAIAAGLAETAARVSTRQWPDAKGIRAQAEALRARVAPLAQANAEAYGRALAMMREPGSGDVALGKALAQAAELPLSIAEIAADVAVLSAVVAESGDAGVRGDAAAGAVLAEAAARAAANLVSINLAATADDPRVAQARESAAAAAEAAERALAKQD
jgi:methenyltetrahydrofolate cyclohydrolase